MSRLRDLYQAMETLRKEGVSTEDLEHKVEKLEEEIIKNEILPALSSDIAPRLNSILRDLVLVVEYHPGEPISVALSRKAKISEMTGAKVLTPRSSTPVKSVEKLEYTNHKPTKHVENATKGLKVTFPDGTIVWHYKAIDTFIGALRKIGLERISALNIKHGGYNLVCKDKRPTMPGRIWQHECDGWYIYSNISNGVKVEDLKYISNYYHLKLKIEVGKPENTHQRVTRFPVINEDASYWNFPIKEQFHSFLLRHLAEDTVASYISTLDNAVRLWINKVVDINADSVYSYTSSEDVRICIDMLNASSGYLEENARKHNSMSASLNKYLSFIEDWEKKHKG